MRERAPLALLSLLSLLSGGSTAGARTPSAPAPSPLVVYADSDDDDADGTADGTQTRLDAVRGRDVRWLSASELSLARGARILSPIARWVVDGRPLANGAALAGGVRAGIQGLKPGQASVLFGKTARELLVVELAAFDTHGARVDLATSHASISRVLPAFLSDDAAGAADQDALRWVLIGPESALPERVSVASERPSGDELDVLSEIELWSQSCPAGTAPELACRTSPLIRATVDPIDRGHPESAGRSLRAEVGGKLVVSVAGRKIASMRVGGPRTTALGPIERYRARLRVHVLRATLGGLPALGGTPAEAIELARAEVDAANLIWGQCGVHFGPSKDVFVQVVDPPQSQLLSVGCSLGLPASGGELRLRAGKKPFRLATAFGDTPLAVASRLVQLLEAAGFSVMLSKNPRIESGALETADLVVRLKDEPVTIERDGELPLSSDPSLELCLGAVDFSDGLDHFFDHDAPAGTLEERTLLRAYSDRDPSSIEVFVIPRFSGQGRVGESFLDGSGAALRNTVVVDRFAVRAGARSHVLAHELGHVLLDMPGHPDDYGVDQPSALMDADATDPSIFGPRRLSIEECERTLGQRGPNARTPLLTPWPLVERR